MTPLQRLQWRPIRMEQGGWQPLVLLPKLGALRVSDPLRLLLLPMLGYMLVCVGIAALLIYKIGPLSAW